MIEGIIHGRSIEWETDPGLADGQRIKVTIELAAEASPVPGGREVAVAPALAEALRRARGGRRLRPPSPTGPGRLSAAGMLADDPDWEDDLREVLRERESPGSPIPGLRLDDGLTP